MTSCVFAIVYWSGTGNTEAMAKIAKGVQKKGAECKLFMADEFNETMMDDYQAIAFGCPSMGEKRCWKKRNLNLCSVAVNLF